MNATRWDLHLRATSQLLAWSRWLHSVELSAQHAAAARQHAGGPPDATLAAVLRLKPKDNLPPPRTL